MSIILSILQAAQLAISLFSAILLTLAFASTRNYMSKRWRSIHDWILIPINIAWYLQFVRRITAQLSIVYPDNDVILMLDRIILPFTISILTFVGITVGLYMITRELARINKDD